MNHGIQLFDKTATVTQRYCPQTHSKKCACTGIRVLSNTSTAPGDTQGLHDWFGNQRLQASTESANTARVSHDRFASHIQMFETGSSAVAKLKRFSVRLLQVQLGQV